MAWLIGALASTLTPFIIAAILAYVLQPLMHRLTAAHLRLGKYTLKLPHTVAAAILLLFTLFIVIGLLLIVLPVVQKQAVMLQAKLPLLTIKLDAQFAPWLSQWLGREVHFDWATLKSLLSDGSIDNLKDSVKDNVLAGLKSGVRTGGGALLSALGIVLAIPLILFYFLMDWDEMMHKLRRLVPQRFADSFASITNEIDTMLGQYLRGQLSVMVVLAVYYAAALGLAGFDVALPVGILTGILVIIPYLGFALGLVLAVIAAILQFDGAQGLIWVAVIYGFGQIVEGFYLTPRWVGGSVGLHPVAVLFALLAFGALLGFVGVLLALPLSAIAWVLLRRALGHYVQSDFYRLKP